MILIEFTDEAGDTYLEEFWGMSHIKNRAPGLHDKKYYINGHLVTLIEYEQVRRSVKAQHYPFYTLPQSPTITAAKAVRKPKGGKLKRL